VQEEKRVDIVTRIAFCFSDLIVGPSDIHDSDRLGTV